MNNDNEHGNAKSECCACGGGYPKLELKTYKEGHTCKHIVDTIGHLKSAEDGAANAVKRGCKHF